MKLSAASPFTCAVLVLVLLAVDNVSGQAAPAQPAPAQPAPAQPVPPAAPAIIDITHEYVPTMPTFGSLNGLGEILRLVNDMKNKSLTNNSELKMNVHSGTHIDAPSHVYQEYWDAGNDVNSLDLETLNGPAIVVDVPRDSNITAAALQGLNIPKGTKRVLFRTLNTDKKLMFTKAFDWSYVGFMEDGAQWIVDNGIKLVGTDYLSSAAFANLIGSHKILLKNKDIVVVEALKLDIPKAMVNYNLHCLPLRLHADASPARCVLIPIP